MYKQPQLIFIFSKSVSVIIPNSFPLLDPLSVTNITAALFSWTLVFFSISLNEKAETSLDTKINQIGRAHV